MKYLDFILFLFFSLQILNAQGGPQAPIVELNVQSIGGNKQDNVKFTIIPIEFQFCRENSCDINIYSSMTEYSVPLPGEAICLSSGFGLRSCTDVNTIYTHDCSDFMAKIAPLRYSLYKVEVWLENRDQESTFSLKKFFYYDNRDYGFVIGECDENGCVGNDFTIRYVVDQDKLHFFKNSTINPFATVDKILSDGDIISWADWKECDYRDFIEFWPNDL